MEHHYFHEELLRQNVEEVFDQAKENIEDLASQQQTSAPNRDDEKRSGGWNQSLTRLWRATGFHNQTLLDLIKLFSSIAIPVLLYMLTKQQADNAMQDQQQEIMSQYLEKMTELIEKGIDDSGRTQIAEALTLNTTRRLDGEGRGQILKFLYESDLIGGKCSFNPKTLSIDKGSCQRPLIELSDAKLGETFFDRPISLAGIDLQAAVLSNSNLPGVDLASAEMTGARLSAATLNHAMLNNANLTSAKLDEAEMMGVYLEGANLTNALLRAADLRGVDLTKVILSDPLRPETHADLKGAFYNTQPLKIIDHNNQEITLSPTQFPPGFDPESRGMRVRNLASTSQ